MQNSTSNYYAYFHNLRASGSNKLLPIKGMYSPKRSTVKNILAYSKALEVTSSESGVGKKITVVLN